MKKFLTKLLILVAPLLVLLVLLEINNRNHDSSSKFFQKKLLAENKHELEGVILGPSHTWRSIHPKYIDYKVASLALSGSSPNVDYLIYEYAKEQVQPSFYIFDLSQMYLAKQNDDDWIKAKKLPYYYPNIKTGALTDLFIIRVPLRNYLFLDYKKPKYDRWGFNSEIRAELDIFKQLNYQDSLILNHPSTQGVLKKQLEEAINNKTHLNAVLYKKIISECIEKGVKVVFLSPPKYHLYNENIEERYAIERQEFLDQVVDDEHVFFLNYENFNEHNPKFFFDFNHLNIDGTEAFSKELNKSLRKILEES